MVSVAEGFPDAAYLIVGSRLIPGVDGGYTVATLQRARLLAASGVDQGRGPLLLTVDPGAPAEHAAHRAEFARRGLITGADRMRNLFDEAAAPEGGAASWLRDAALRDPADLHPDPGDPDPADPDRGDPDLGYRAVTDAADRPVLDLPVVADPDWHTSTAPIVLRDAAGAPVGTIPGFGALYRAWLDRVVAGIRAQRPGMPVVLVCESRQVGELIARWRPPGVRLVHTVHTIHLEPPYTPDAPVNPLWRRWLDASSGFDAVLWPTDRQRADVEARFGRHPGSAVVPLAAPEPPAHPVPRDGMRVVSLARLAPGKRVDHTLRAWERVIRAVPGARLELYGGGPLRGELESLAQELGIAASVLFHGHTDAGPAIFDGAAAMVQSTAFEGQGLAALEALSRGCPVVSYDVRYGPAEALAAGGGILVPDGDIAALADALITLLRDDSLQRRLAVEAVDRARAFSPARTAAAFAAALRTRT